MMMELDHWLRNRKWWWSIVFWAIGVILTNSYVLYTKMCDEDNVPPQDRISHYNFLRDIDSFSVKTDAVLKTYRLFMEIDTKYKIV